MNEQETEINGINMEENVVEVNETTDDNEETFDTAIISNPEILVDKKMKKKNSSIKRGVKKLVGIITMSALAGTVFGFAFLGVFNYGGYLLPQDEEITIEDRQILSTETITGNVSEVDTSVTEVASNVMPSIVSITNLSVQEVMSFFGGSHYYESESAGSGIIIGMNDTELLILTNNHVIDGSTTLTVALFNEETVEATVKGGNSGQDIAVISVLLEDLDEETKDSIKIATLGDSTQLKAGEPVIAIGNALGYGQSVTTGVVSALNRTITGIDGELIQTDAAINPGNSGGALLNAKGEVIGINTVKVSESSVEGMGYAIPITDATDTIENLMNRITKPVVSEENRGYLGIQGVNVTEDTSGLYNMPVGVYIAEVFEGGGAYKAGIKKGSIITAMDGVTIENMEDLQEEVSYCAIGDEIKVTIQVPTQNGEYNVVEVIVFMEQMPE